MTYRNRSSRGLGLACAVGGILAAWVAGGVGAARPTPPDFTRDVRPILARNCFKCHGPDDQQRQAGLRLDRREDAVRSGVLVPGKPQAGRLVQRILAADATVMPPASSGKRLTAAEKETLRRWVAAGAEYRVHWAFVAPRQAPPPTVRQAKWVRNPIDAFVLHRLEREGLAPSPEADRFTLIRRLSLDLTGLPPTPEEADAFVGDKSPNAYEKLVDRLMASPHYGERWARRWLDLARYADTNGYEKDRPRSVWPYRDWVIQALNQDMPFDQFTVEQLAGDLLPNATVSQRIATGFHRNTMLNEEGGIDPLEFRFHAMTDRMATTGTTWLGLTIGCAQCHTHKFDPIPQREYYQVMAFLNNADEPEMPVPQPELTAAREKLSQEIAAREAGLADQFPVETAMDWQVSVADRATSAGGAGVKKLPDGSLLLEGPNPDKDVLTVLLPTTDARVDAVRIEALPDASLGGGGPGRTPHGNFVLSEVGVTVGPAGSVRPVKVASASADFAQEGFPPSQAIDGKENTGWAIQGPGSWNVRRTLVLTFAEPVQTTRGGLWALRLSSQHGTQHTLGRLRISFGRSSLTPDQLSASRRGALNRAIDQWIAAQEPGATRWDIVRPQTMTSNMPRLTLQADGSVFADGDTTKRDVYDLTLMLGRPGVTAIRLEAMPDARLPRMGPGRVYYEGAPGDFFLSELVIKQGSATLPFSGASHSFAAGGTAAAMAIDGSPLSGWSTNGGQGREHHAVFRFAQPLQAGGLQLQMVFERYYAAALGRFRVSVTYDTGPTTARFPAEVESALARPRAERTEADRRLLRDHFLQTAPELAAAREEIARLRAAMPQYPTALVMQERPADNVRPTFVHQRGEYLRAQARVEPAVFSALPDMAADTPRNRLGFARWLVDPRNPLTARVTVNRQWAALFGRGIVRTTEDFGLTGDAPTHPELLDWLAVEFRKQGWSLKKLHRLLVTSATYRQRSGTSAALQSRDPQNLLLARGPRLRLEAELLRDQALAASGLLSRKLGGPSVFPPQPPGITSEGTYGPLQWKVSEGEDRYRRGLYTFSKRTAPYAMFSVFDAPSGEACVARREVSNTPLQALTMLNDTVLIEAAQALGRLTVALPGSPEQKATTLFRRCLVRPPQPEELRLLMRFYESQRRRLDAKELDSTALAGPGEGDIRERAAWVVTARSVLNLDEMVVRE